MKVNNHIYKLVCFSYFLLIILLSSQTGCTKSKKNISITKVGELAFRRFYAGIQFNDMSDDILDSIKNGNPSGFNQDTFLLKQLQGLGLLNNQFDLLRPMFKIISTLQFELYNDKGEKLTGEFKRPLKPNGSDLYNLIVTGEKQSFDLELEGHYGMLNDDIKYLLLDVFPGGYKEIVILNEYYIMNGDNSDVYVYEIK